MRGFISKEMKFVLQMYRDGTALTRPGRYRAVLKAVPPPGTDPYQGPYPGTALHRPLFSVSRTSDLLEWEASRSSLVTDAITLLSLFDTTTEPIAFFLPSGREAVELLRASELRVLC